MNLRATRIDRTDFAIRTEGRGPAVSEGNFFHSTVRTYIDVSASTGRNGVFAIRVDRHLPRGQGIPVDALHRCPVLVQVLNALPSLCGRQSFLLQLLDLRRWLLTRRLLHLRLLAWRSRGLLHVRRWLLGRRLLYWRLPRSIRHADR